MSLSGKAGLTRVGWLVIAVLLLLLGGMLVGWLRWPVALPEEEVARPAPPELSRSNLVLTEGRLMRVGADVPFTGIMLEHYADGTLRSHSMVSNGLLEGLSEGFYTNGQRQVAEPFAAGVSHGRRTKWYLNGTKMSEAEIVDGQLHGTFRRWYESGQLSEQANFVRGNPEGESLAFFPSGYLKARVILTNGQPAEQTYYKDGEMKP